MTDLLRARTSRIMAIAAIMLAFVANWLTPPIVGDDAGSYSDSIRIGLFVDLGAKYKAAAQTVTLSSATGMQLGEAGGVTWVSTKDAKPVRVSLDQFMVQLVETSDLAVATNVFRAVPSAAPAADQPYVFALNKKGKTVYQVAVGHYASKEEAVIAKDRLLKNAGLSAGLKGAKPTVVGSLHWIAGTYTTEAEAEAVVQTAGNAGLDAFVVYRTGTEGAAWYAAWIGQAADTDELNAMKAQVAKALPNANLLQPDPNLSYMLKRDDMSAKLSGQDVTTHYFVSSGGQKITAVPQQEGTIKVAERAARTYRGILELSQYNNRLAVINELLLEQYLYSVVSVEMGTKWPAEALKAQAVASRTYALKQGNKYQIAHLIDGTLNQAYNGVGVEKPDVVAAVEATSGEVIVNEDGLIEAVYSSNSGKMTADPTEAWGNPAKYLGSVPSPDEIAEKNLPTWHRVVLSNGKSGYIRGDLLKDSGEKTTTGFPVMVVQTDATNVRPMPYAPASGSSANAPVDKANKGDRVVSFEQTVESNSMSWIRGPYDPKQLLATLNGKVKTKIADPLLTLVVTKRGPSERVTELTANGRIADVAYPDLFRTALNGLPSTRFEIDAMGSYTILGADGATRQVPEQSGALYIQGGAGSDGKAQALSTDSMFFMNSAGEVRLASTTPLFRFVGFGNGHGIGMSQWGARGLADKGYDYRKILQYYYKDVSIVKE